MMIILMPSAEVEVEEDEPEAFPCNLASSSATRASSLSTVPLSWSTSCSPRGAIVEVYDGGKERQGIDNRERISRKTIGRCSQESDQVACASGGSAFKKSSSWLAGGFAFSLPLGPSTEVPCCISDRTLGTLTPASFHPDLHLAVSNPSILIGP